MSVTGVAGTEREAKLRQVERLISSDLLHGSESLCKLLRYLAEHAVDHPGIGVKEYQIATEVFKRPSNFDPRMDSTVRVQTGRLRSKLAEYYAHAREEDQWAVEIPKGSYTLTFQLRPPAVHLAEPAAAAQAVETSHLEVTNVRRWIVAVSILSGLLLICLIALILMLPRHGNAPAVAQTPAPPELVSFWSRFIDNPDEPLVVFSNADFVGRPETGMHYFNALTDKGQPIHDHYTGVGEVIAIHELDRVFSLLHHDLRVKRGRLLSMDDVKNTDVIFVGSPSENLTLREMPTTQDFVFKRLEQGPRKGDLAVVNIHPNPGEASQYLSTAQLPVVEDYAVIGLMPGLNPARWVLVLAGLTTFGTQASVEYVCRSNTVQELLKQVTVSPAGRVMPFEAVIQVKISGGVPVHSDLVALRVRK
jgi:hypothetical protein